jgi:hypothetical protein
MVQCISGQAAQSPVARPSVQFALPDGMLMLATTALWRVLKNFYRLFSNLRLALNMFNSPHRLSHLYKRAVLTLQLTILYDRRSAKRLR